MNQANNDAPRRPSVTSVNSEEDQISVDQLEARSIRAHEGFRQVNTKIDLEEAEDIDLDSKPKTVAITSPARKFITSQDKNFRLVDTPNDQDVLFGRGRPYQSHPGNRNLHRLVSLHKDRYEKSRRFDKLAIADQIVRAIKSGEGSGSPGRFLRRVEGSVFWEEAPDVVSRDKVSHVMRGQIKQARESHTRRTIASLGPGREGTSCVDLSLPDRFLIDTMTSSGHSSGVNSLISPLMARSLLNSPILQRAHPRIEALPGNLSVGSMGMGCHGPQLGMGSHDPQLGMGSHSPQSNLTNAFLVQLQRQQQQRQYQNLFQASRFGANTTTYTLQQVLAASCGNDFPVDSLRAIVATQQQERQIQENQLLLRLLNQSNQMDQAFPGSQNVTSFSTINSLRQSDMIMSPLSGSPTATLEYDASIAPTASVFVQSRGLDRVRLAQQLANLNTRQAIQTSTRGQRSSLADDKREKEPKDSVRRTI